MTRTETEKARAMAGHVAAMLDALGAVMARSSAPDPQTVPVLIRQATEANTALVRLLDVSMPSSEVKPPRPRAQDDSDV